MRFFHNTALMFVLFLLVNSITHASFWPCQPCNGDRDCEVDPLDACVWGETRDICNRRVCSKGPGERCGGPLNLLGECGEGMMCKSDERCHGCSIQTMQCYP